MVRTRSFGRPARTLLPADIRLMNTATHVLMLFGAITICALALVWLARQPMFAVQSIRIEGDVAHNSASTIRANALPHLAGTFFTLDLARARQAFESVPWVRHAIVRRVWPNRLAVQLEEHRPVALWREPDNAEAEQLVNSHGEVFEANLGDVEDDALPTLQGPDGSSAHVLALLDRLEPVFAPLGRQVDTLVLSGRGSWRIELDNDAQLQLGRGNDDDVMARTERFVATLPQVAARFQRPLEYADLRYRDGYAVRLKGVTTGVPAAAKK